MNLYELPFAKIIILREDIAEVIVNDGVEMDTKMVDEYHEFLLSHLNPPFSLLINKINSYSYDFEAQMQLATLKEINAMAVVSYRRTTDISTEMLTNNVPRDTEWNLQIFQDREKALAWLFSEQKKSNKRVN
jgi:hypothetical protein